MSGFTSLSPEGSGQDQAEPSFWPSFTDIMMVVVMIFLLSSLVMFVKNLQLANHLTDSEEAERQARAEIQSTLSVNATLEEQLDYLQEALMRSRLAQMRLSEQKSRQQRLLDTQIAGLQQQLLQLESRVSERDQRLASREQALSALTNKQQRSSARLSQANQDLREREQTISEQQQQLQAQQDTLATQLATIAELEQAQVRWQREQATRDEALDSLQSQAELTQADLTALETRYQTLQAEYDKLVRPARSSEGKVVVSVRHYQRGSRLFYQLRERGGWQSMSRTALEKRLAALKNTHSGDLYIKIVFPDNSGLEYSEAWAFTRDMLNQFDYYYQSNPTN